MNDHTLDEQLTSDLAALQAASHQGLPSLAHTERLLASRKAPMPMTKRPLFLTFAAGAGLVLVLFAPVPYSRIVGYDLRLSTADGQTRTLHLYDVSAKAAERRASLVRARTHAQVAVAPVRARRWGNVYAMVQNELNIRVDTDGKTDAEVQDEIAAQLAAAGWSADVKVDSGKGWSSVDITADDGAGKKMQIIRKVQGDPAAAKHIDLSLGDGVARLVGPGGAAVEIASDRSSSDAELKAKIEAQLAKQGVTDAEVTVTDGRVRVEMRHEQKQ